MNAQATKAQIIRSSREVIRDTPELLEVLNWSGGTSVWLRRRGSDVLELQAGTAVLHAVLER